MKIHASVENSHGRHRVRLATNERTHELAIAAKAEGRGSSTNGGELLMLALATCYCNDAYREAAQRGIQIDEIGVDVEATFGAEGEAAKDITFQVRVRSPAPGDKVRELLQAADHKAEVHNTLRQANTVRLSQIEVMAPGT